MKGIQLQVGSTKAGLPRVRFCQTGQVPQALKGTNYNGGFLETFPIFDGTEMELCVGLGAVTAPLTVSQQMEVFAVIAGFCKKHGMEALEMNLQHFYALCDMEGLHPGVCAGIGLTLGGYAYRAEETPALCVYVPDVAKEYAGNLEEGVTLGETLCGVRRLVDCPANQLPPEAFAQTLTQWLSPVGVRCRTMDRKELAALGFNGLLAVGDSAKVPPCLLVMQLQTNKNLRHTAIVGKGVTFDSGGTCLKPAGSMTGAKGDMAGAAAAAGALYAMAKSGCDANVTVVLPMCENRLTSGSVVPGDIYTAYGGKTVEVLNTDAEGRLILADGVSYAIQTLKCEQVIDIATLTGAVVRALGFTVAGAVTNDMDLWRRFRKAAETTDECYWRLPAFPEHERMIKSDIADVKNLGEPHCGAITGGLFIGAFAEGTPWLHLDIAGTASVEKPERAYQKKGATGAGVLALYQFLQGEAQGETP